ncbi:hypothetical protein BKA66DRAFT_405569 [Pyrenochaeta sp. MPI-SDFR-AT-0127]|nr:hypothetical protein BKA66DRAFT_405569 [Pyrenochaeta sp. MPI-SDFR-AT-0127]
MDDIGTAWHQNGSGVSIWAEQLYLSSWGSNNYTNPSISALQPSFPPLSNRLTTLLAHPVPLHYSSDTNIKSASFTSSPNTIVDTIVNGGDSDSDSDSSNSEDESDCGQNKRSHCSTNTRHQGRQNTSPVLKLGKWTAPVDPYDQTDQRHYLCPFSSKADPNGGICRQRFVRPEHLRRHVKTVHGTAREYTCKVPKCRRAFSRGDNLRDHYWTHLSRGGRAGRNDKMSLEELKVILGPKERKLLRRLKAKLNKHKNRGMLRSKL